MGGGGGGMGVNWQIKNLFIEKWSTYNPFKEIDWWFFFNFNQEFVKYHPAHIWACNIVKSPLMRCCCSNQENEKRKWKTKNDVRNNRRHRNRTYLFSYLKCSFQKKNILNGKKWKLDFGCQAERSNVAEPKTDQVIIIIFVLGQRGISLFLSLSIETTKGTNERTQVKVRPRFKHLNTQQQKERKERKKER